MFSEQVPTLMARLIQAGFSQQQAQALGDVLGNCTQALEHRGPVTFAGPNPAPIGTPGITDGYGANVPPGSTINVQGDSQFAGDNLFTTTSVTTFDGTVNLNGDTTVNGDTTFEGDTVFHGSVDFGSSTPTGDWVGKCKVNTNDTLAFLEDQLQDHQSSPQYSATHDVLIKSDTNTVSSDRILRFYWHVTDVSGYSGSGKNAFIVDSGVPKFIAPTALTPQAIAPSTLTPSATTVVTDVSWDTGTCVMTKTTGTAYTFPSSSAVYVFPNSTTRYGFPDSSQINYFAG